MLNKVMLIGNLGADPEVRDTPSGATVANLRIATTEKWKSKDGERQEETQWHSVSFWGKQAEIAQQYLHKGSKVFVEGSIRYRQYEHEGVTKYSTDIKGMRFVMLDPKGGGDQGQSMPRTHSKPSKVFDDDIPF
jgi:single-strand DNA-binding protein